MNLGSVIFWTSLIGVMVMGVVGYEHYYKNLRAQGKSLQKATNQMGSLNQDLKKVRNNYNSVLGVDTGKVSGNKKIKGVGAGASGGLRKGANSRMKELQKRRQGARR